MQIKPVGGLKGTRRLVFSPATTKCVIFQIRYSAGIHYYYHVYNLNWEVKDEIKTQAPINTPNIIVLSKCGVFLFKLFF